MNYFPSDASRRKGFLFLLASGLLLRILAVVFFQSPLVSDDRDYVALARSLTSGDGYMLDGKPTAYRMPGYPFIIAFTYMFLGESNLWMKLIQVAADLLTCILVFAIGKQMFSEAVGLLAMGIAVYFPINILYVPQLMTETLFTTLLLFITWLSLSDQDDSWIRKNILLGVIIGLAVLFRATALVLPIAILIYRIMKRTPKVLYVRDIALMMAAVLLVLAPWILRNYSEFHRIAITSNSGVNFWMGNHTGASGSYSYPQMDNPLSSVHDDFDRSDLGFQLGLEFIRTHPIGSIVLLGKKFAHYFGTDYWLLYNLEYNPLWVYYPNAATVYSELSIWSVALTHLPFMGILLFGIFGFLFSNGTSKSQLRLIISLVVLWLIVHLVFYAGARYRFPTVPFLILGAAQGFQLWKTQNLSFSKLRLAVFVCLSSAFIVGWVAERWIIQSKKMPKEQLRLFLEDRQQTMTVP